MFHAHQIKSCDAVEVPHVCMMPYERAPEALRKRHFTKSSKQNSRRRKKHCFYITKGNAPLDFLAVDSFKIMDFICGTEWLLRSAFIQQQFASRNLENTSPAHTWQLLHPLPPFCCRSTIKWKGITSWI